MSNSLYWLIASAILFALEAFGAPGVGFLFAAVAAILTAAIIELGLIDPSNDVMQFAIFFVLTAATAALLWKKLKKWRLNPNAPNYSNIVGTEGIVSSGGITGHAEGVVLWSGTRMRARLNDPAQSIAEGQAVTIVRVDGNILYITAKH